jgi:hypothetical protein
LDSFVGVSALSRGRMDARTVQELRSTPIGFRRLPVPGIFTGGRCERDRSGVFVGVYENESGRGPGKNQ